MPQQTIAVGYSFRPVILFLEVEYSQLYSLVKSADNHKNQYHPQ